MNAEAARARAEWEAVIRKLGGSSPARLHALQHLQLKAVIKESHCTPVHQLVYNAADTGCSNLLASVGGNQATVYDDTHLEARVGVAVHFVNERTEHAGGGDLRTATWLRSAGGTRHAHGDACLAVAGADRSISIISVVEARVISLLHGHEREVIELATPRGGGPGGGRLLSLAKDGNIRLWDVPAAACLASYPSDATAMAVSPDGLSLVTGNRKGALQRWSLPQSFDGGGHACGGTTEQVSAQGSTQGLRTELKLEGRGHSEALECIRFLLGSRLASKSSDGRLCVWDMVSRAQLSSWKVPGGGGESGGVRCQFSVTADGTILCTGNQRGDVFLYDTADGALLKHLESSRVCAPVAACALSTDGRCLWAAAGNGFILRYEYRKPLVQQDNGGKESAD